MVICFQIKVLAPTSERFCFQVLIHCWGEKQPSAGIYSFVFPKVFPLSNIAEKKEEIYYTEYGV